MVLASHVIFTAYGFWLPNDPRGSWSAFVGSWELSRFGPATKTTERRSLARDPHDRAKRLAAKAVLQRPAVVFDGLQARAVARGFQTYVQSAGLTVWACSIMPEHVHMVIARHELDVEKLVIQLKKNATEQLLAEHRHPYQPETQGETPPKCWARGEWKVFLDSDAALEKLGEACSAACRPIDDKRGTIEFRTKVAAVLAKRAAKIAYGRAGGK